MRIAKHEAEDELQKEEARKLKAANTAYNKQIAEEKRQKAAREKEGRERKQAEERLAINARKAERARNRSATLKTDYRLPQQASTRLYSNKKL